MNKAALLLSISLIIVGPFTSGADARGGFGGFRGGGAFGGFHGGGGFDRDRFDRGGFEGAGGFEHAGFEHAGFDPGTLNRYGAGSLSGIGSRAFPIGHLPTDGGLSTFAAGGSGMVSKVDMSGMAHSATTIDANHLSAQGISMRNSFNHDNFTNVNVNRYGGYHNYGYGYHGWGAGGWYCPGWSPAEAWTFMGVSTLSSFLGMGLIEEAMASNSGGAGKTVNNVTYEGDNVYLNSKALGTAQQYYQQAKSLASLATAPQEYIAQSEPTSAQGNIAAENDNKDENEDLPAAAVTTYLDTNEKWQALGVFALAEPGQTDSNMLLQLAINQKGILRGNYTNQLTNENAQIYGALDKKSERISWTIGSSNATVFDTSLADLVKDDSAVLVHYGAAKTKVMALIRLPPPEQEPKAQT